MLENRQITDWTKGGKCPPGCHNCCANLLPLSEQEIATIQTYIKKNNIPVNNPNNVLSTYVDECPFVNDRGCSIYPVRPEICRYYSCNPANKGDFFHHENKSMVNMLLTFKPNAFTPKDTPSVENLDYIYQVKKERIGL